MDILFSDMQIRHFVSKRLYLYKCLKTIWLITQAKFNGTVKRQNSDVFDDFS